MSEVIIVGGRRPGMATLVALLSGEAPAHVRIEDAPPFMRTLALTMAALPPGQGSSGRCSMVQRMPEPEAVDVLRPDGCFDPDQRRTAAHERAVLLQGPRRGRWK